MLYGRRKRPSSSNGTKALSCLRNHLDSSDATGVQVISEKRLRPVEVEGSGCISTFDATWFQRHGYASLMQADMLLRNTA